MTVAMYQISVPVFDRRLKAHAAILDKAAAHAEAKKIDPSAFMTDRLYPDMFPFWLQVQSACDHAKNSTARLTGVELPIFDETEKTFEGLKARIAKTLEFVNRRRPGRLRGRRGPHHHAHPERARAADDRARLFPELGAAQLLFHLTTAYGILRHNGVEIGKRDFMGNPPA